MRKNDLKRLSKKAKRFIDIWIPELKINNTQKKGLSEMMSNFIIVSKKYQELQDVCLPIKLNSIPNDQQWEKFEKQVIGHC